MRAYKFLTEEFALKSLRERRIKISQYDDLNDPFDLIPFDLSDKIKRRAMRDAIRQLTADHGLVCLSAGWRDPVIWAHYSDKHRGICLGFDVKEQNVKRVEYVPERLPFPDEPGPKDSDTMLFTKFDNWAYEQEIRAWANLDDEDHGHYYKDFDESFRLAEVIVGPRCKTSRQAVLDALSPLDSEARLIKARAGFKRFEIVEDERGFGSGDE